MIARVGRPALASSCFQSNSVQKPRWKAAMDETVQGAEQQGNVGMHVVLLEVATSAPVRRLGRHPHRDARAEYGVAVAVADHHPDREVIAPVASTSGTSGVATACIGPLALRRYSTVMPRGIQRIDVGRLASVITPATSSARLHRAIACTVPRWLVTLRRWRMVASQRPGSSRVMRGLMVAK